MIIVPETHLVVLATSGLGQGEGGEGRKGEGENKNSQAEMKDGLGFGGGGGLGGEGEEKAGREQAERGRSEVLTHDGVGVGDVAFLVQVLDARGIRYHHRKVSHVIIIDCIRDSLPGVSIAHSNRRVRDSHAGIVKYGKPPTD